MREQTGTGIDSWVMQESGKGIANATALEILVRRTFGEWVRAPPVDPIAVAESVACRVVLRNVPAARLVVSASGVEILIPTAFDYTRRRFSVAHELGHLIFIRAENGQFKNAV